MDLDGVIREILEFGSEYNPLLARRLALFHMKRESDDHSPSTVQYFHKIGQALGNADFKKMSHNQLAVHLCLSGADSIMANQAS